MGDELDRLLGYGSRLVAGLVACAAVAATMHADGGALTILTAVTLVVLALTSVMWRGGRL